MLYKCITVCGLESSTESMNVIKTIKNQKMRSYRNTYI